jgi:hypothetical protein
MHSNALSTTNQMKFHLVIQNHTMQLLGKYNEGIPENSRLGSSEAKFLRDQYLNNLG